VRVEEEKDEVKRLGAEREGKERRRRGAKGMGRVCGGWVQNICGGAKCGRGKDGRGMFGRG